jgi:uncharacterized membrane protein YqaE (UPF0057 family)
MEMSLESKAIFTLVSLMVPFFGPSISIAIKDGMSIHLLFGLILSLFFHIPGALYAIWRIWK